MDVFSQILRGFFHTLILIVCGVIDILAERTMRLITRTGLPGLEGSVWALDGL